jgi:hypothetical protein
VSPKTKEAIRLLVAALLGAASALGLDSVGEECPPVIINAPRTGIPWVDAGPR